MRVDILILSYYLSILKLSFTKYYEKNSLINNWCLPAL